MPASVKMTSEVTAIIAGHGDVSLAVALGTLAAAPGIVYAVKKLQLWEKFSPVEQHELELLDADMPSGWWRRFKETLPGVAMTGHRLRRPRKGPWSIGTTDEGDILITTPVLDEETGELAS